MVSNLTSNFYYEKSRLLWKNVNLHISRPGEAIKMAIQPAVPAKLFESTGSGSGTLGKGIPHSPSQPPFGSLTSPALPLVEASLIFGNFQAGPVWGNYSNHLVIVLDHFKLPPPPPPLPPHSPIYQNRFYSNFGFLG
jgi:hypothetical protein